MDNCIILLYSNVVFLQGRIFIKQQHFYIHFKRILLIIKLLFLEEFLLMTNFYTIFNFIHINILNTYERIICICLFLYFCIICLNYLEEYYLRIF